MAQDINYGSITSTINNKLYPVVADKLTKRNSQFMGMISNFINRHHDAIYALAPYDNIMYPASEKDKLFESLDLREEEVTEIQKECFWYGKPLNPQCAKEEYINTLMCSIMYYLKNKKQKEAEITCIYLAFSGKMYASIFGKFFRTAPPSKYKSVMDYVVNTQLNDKYNIKAEGNIFGAVKKICMKFIDTYKKTLTTNPDDDEIKYMIQQLRGRLSEFIKHISNKYYNAWQNRNYLNFESDNLADGEEFRISDSDATIAARITENAVNYMVSHAVDLKICNGFNDPNIKPTELKGLMEEITHDKNNIGQLSRVCNIIICDFMRRHPNKKVGDVEFLAYWFQQKPNTKDAYIIEMQQTVEEWLERDANYRKRKSRIPTAIAYRKSVIYYLVRIIDYVARKGM